MTNSWFVLLLVILTASAAPPFALFYLSQRSRFAPFLQSLAGVHAPHSAVIGILLSLNLAFVCNEIWHNRDTANAAMGEEAESLRTIGRIAANIPDRGGEGVLQAARRYLEVVGEVDFPQDRARVQTSLSALSNSSLPALIALSDRILDSQTLDKIHPAVRPLLLAQLSIIRDKRLERVALTHVDPNPVKWLSLLFLEFMTLVTVFVTHIQNGRAMVVATLIFLSSVNPFIVILYETRSPFTGINALSGAPLTAALERIRSLQSGQSTHD